MDRRGFLSLVLAVTLALTAIATLGMLKLMQDWRRLTREQIALDRCTGKAALELKRTLNQTESLNREVERLRVAIAAATLQPAVAVPLRQALLVAVGAQTFLLGRWKFKQAQWFFPGACEGYRHLPVPLPNVPYTRPPPDGLGPRPLVWTAAHHSLRIRAEGKHRRAAAETWREGATTDVDEKWKAKWIRP
ncbi:MAG: hypothetical protein AB7P04_02715 [Bacteriovoracia bacterium]